MEGKGSADLIGKAPTINTKDEIEKLQNELGRLQKRLGAYEGPAEDQTSAEDEKKKIKKIFDMFDVDGSGDLDAEEFQELAFLLGETLTLDEVKERIKLIDQDDSGTIDFREFYEWWVSPDHSFIKSTRKDEDLRVLKAKLRSKALLRTVTRINDERKEQLKTAEGGESAKVVDDGNTRLNINIAVGELQKVAASLALDVVEDEKAASVVRQELNASETSIILSLAFTIKDGVSDFELGEVSGTLKTLLGFFKKEFGFSGYKIQLAQEDGVRIFKIFIVLNKADFPEFEAVDAFFQAVHPKNFNATVELSQSPLNQSPDEVINSRIAVRGEFQRQSLAMLNDLIYGGSQFGFRRKKKSWFWESLSSLSGFEFDLKFDSMQDLWERMVGDHRAELLEELGLEKDAKVPVNGWANIKPLLMRPVTEQVIKIEEGESDMPYDALENYFTIIQLFKGIHSFKLQVGNLALRVSTKNLDLFALLPTKADVDNARDKYRQKKKEEQISFENYLQKSGVKETPMQREDKQISEELDSDKPTTKTFAYQYDLDKNGVIYFLDYKLDQVPEVFCSGQGRGMTLDFIARDNVFCWTNNKPNSWFCVDLGINRKLIPSKYTLRYGSSGSYCCPRNWILQGAVKLSKNMNDLNSPDWVTLREHVDDKSLNGSFATFSWDIEDPKTAEGFRYFRVLQTGPNSFQAPPNKPDEWSNAFVVSGLELYGELISIKLEEEEEPEIDVSAPGQLDFEFLFDNDTEGIVYYLRENKRAPIVTASSTAKGVARDFVKRGEVFSWTQNAPFSWYMIDLGNKRRIIPNYYSFRYASSGAACCPRNWLLQGANEIKDLKTNNNPDSEDWTTLSVHQNDKTMNSDFATGSWAVEDCTESFRYFRIIQTGPNCFTGGTGWKDVLVASGFEVYGSLVTLEGPEDDDVDSDDDFDL